MIFGFYFFFFFFFFCNQFWIQNFFKYFWALADACTVQVLLLYLMSVCLENMQKLAFESRINILNRSINL